MIDTTAEQARFPGKILCYVAIHSPISRDDRFAIGIAVLGEAGYSLPSELEFFTTYKEASIRAEELNKVFPYDADACVAIVADTMIRQRERRPTVDRLGDLLLEAEEDRDDRPPGRRRQTCRDENRFLRCRAHVPIGRNLPRWRIREKGISCSCVQRTGTLKAATCDPNEP